MRYLKTKAWIVCALIIVAPAFIIILGVYLSQLTGIQGITFFSSIISSAVLILSYYGWIWTFGRVFKNRNSTGFISQQTFQYFLPISILFAFIVIPILSTQFSLNAPTITFLQLVSFLTFLLCIYISALSFRSYESEKEWPIAKTFFSIWFLPIGIWFLKPRLNQVLRRLEGNQ